MTAETLAQTLDELSHALEALRTQLSDTPRDVAPAPRSDPASRPWPTEDAILVTGLSSEPDAPPAYAVRDNGCYMLANGDTLYPQDREITSWEPLYRQSHLLSYYALAGLPAGAQVRDRDGRVWTQMTVAWQADDSLEQMDDQDLLVLRGPLVLVHDPGAQQ